MPSSQSARIFTSPAGNVPIPNDALHDYVFRDFASFGERDALIDGPSGRTLTFRAVKSLSERVRKVSDCCETHSPLTGCRFLGSKRNEERFSDTPHSIVNFAPYAPTGDVFGICATNLPEFALIWFGVSIAGRHQYLSSSYLLCGAFFCRRHCHSCEPALHTR